jgi:MoaA/NifB/PqqE/SkfB family radical SAM enzyme
MPPDLFESVAKSAVELGFENLDLTSPGGELFTLRNAVALIETAKKAGFQHIETYTNGIQLHKHDNERLLRSGIDALLISFPGFDRTLYKKIYQVDKYEAFKRSIQKLLQTHERLQSKVRISFEPRTILTLNEICESPFYKEFLSHFLSDKVRVSPPIRVLDTWVGTVKKEDLDEGMKLDITPLKSIYPLKRPYLCNRIYMLGVFANGDVRLCNCRHDGTVETEEHDGLYIDNVSKYEDLKHLVTDNKSEIDGIRSNFRIGKIPSVCRNCAFYLPADLGDY